ncbi:acylphosphatase [Aspergillus ruber CBS 135680]|uniref:acylphosphatase n=1 Tax=Aspergillus ruber (strain CBS 135680) TaxID=1388766 RepID=A0A017S1I4_ASPRC|nr:putative acylphosphatase [Aspergillus ruber CBS 135680]EYE90913.1 putative acylphosphatase [Aspergillus ruber CBS 135680]
MSAQRIAYKVHGTVQGVGYRDFTQRRAAEFGLKGWVKNTSDGLVEGEAQGDQNSVQKLIQELGKGPRLAHVTKLQKKDITPEEGESHYAVRRTSDSVISFD